AEAARGLEAAVRAHPAALHRFEAKTLLRDLGGPDLFEPHERFGGVQRPEEKTPEGADEGESTIEVSDGK
ncbi:MAG: hypothetical protein ACREID_05695, partial [Planctomycetota bacterium]